MKVLISVPDDIVEEWQTDADGVRRRIHLELALHLYATKRLSLGSAVEISGLSRADFEQELANTGIERNYSAQDLETDLAWAAKMK